MRVFTTFLVHRCPACDAAMLRPNGEYLEQDELDRSLRPGCSTPHSVRSLCGSRENVDAVFFDYLILDPWKPCERHEECSSVVACRGGF